MKVKWMVGILAAAGALAVPIASDAATRIGVSIAVGHDSRYGYGDGRGYRNRDTFQIGYDRGFRDGANHGAKDGKNRDGYEFRHDERYRRGDSGYQRGFGPRHEYVSGYRQGFEEAYRRAYRATRQGHDRRDWDRNRDWDGDRRY